VRAAHGTRSAGMVNWTQQPSTLDPVFVIHNSLWWRIPPSVELRSIQSVYRRVPVALMFSHINPHICLPRPPARDQFAAFSHYPPLKAAVCGDIIFEQRSRSRQARGAVARPKGVVDPWQLGGASHLSWYFSNPFYGSNHPPLPTLSPTTPAFLNNRSCLQTYPFVRTEPLFQRRRCGSVGVFRSVLLFISIHLRPISWW
jgi:hypothetical protein